MLAEFRKFIMRGNVLDLAVAVIIGGAFGAVVSAFTDGVLMAFIAAIMGEPNFDAITIEIGDGVILIGTFITAVVNFLIIAAALFAVIRSFERLQARRSAGDVADEEAPAPPEDVVLLREIRDLLAARDTGR